MGLTQSKAEEARRTSGPVESVDLQGVAEFGAVSSGQGKKMLVMAHVKAPLLKVDESQRAPVRVSAVVDRSGSMSGEKLELVKETLQFVIQEMGSQDELGLVVYDDQVQEVCPLVAMTSANKERLRREVEKLAVGGSTNLSGGLLQGLKQTSAGKGMLGFGGSSKNVSSVWLFTDGMANCGIVDADSIVGAMRPWTSKTNAPTVFTFGVGSGHNETMLRKIAEAGSGMYYYLAKPKDIPPAFAECLGGLLSVVGQKVELTVTTEAGTKILRLLSDQLEQKVGEREATMKLKDLYSEEERDVVIEVEVESGKAGTQRLVELKLRYADMTNDGVVREVKAAVEVERVEGEVDETATLNEEVDKQRNRIMVADAMKKAKVEADAGRMKAAEEELKVCMQAVRKSKTAEQKICQELMDDANECLDRMDQWHTGGKMLMEQTEQCHRWQTSCGMANERYCTSAKKAARGKVMGLF